jgi:hypothetical protein
VISRPAQLRKGSQPPAALAAPKATPARCAGFDRSSDCARISFRLQKLASGARSRRPRVNSPSHRLDLAPPCESSARSEKAPEAGQGRQSSRHGGGLPPRKRRGGTCRWKAPRIGEAVLVDARAVEAILALRRRSAMGECGARQGASEAGSPALGAAENATPGKLCLRAELFAPLNTKERCR